MKLNLKTTLLAGALAVAASGSVLANTSIAPGSTGDGSLFLNVIDTTSQTSYTLDLSALNAGNKIKEFNGNASQSFTLTSDANWTAFTAGVGASDNVVYDVVAGNTIVGAQSFTFTSAAATGTTAGSVGGTTNQQLKNNNVDPFINAVNASTNTSTTSLFVQNTGANANPPAYAGTAFQPASGIPSTFAAVGSAMSFYNLSLNGTNTLTKATVTTYAGQWDLTNLATLSYVSAVPLPMPLTLLLSGLALMGIIARRGKSQSDISLSGAAA